MRRWIPLPGARRSASLWVGAPWLILALGAGCVRAPIKGVRVAPLSPDCPVELQPSISAAPPGAAYVGMLTFVCREHLAPCLDKLRAVALQHGADRIYDVEERSVAGGAPFADRQSETSYSARLARSRSCQ